MKKKKILVIEDEIYLLKMIKHKLNIYGYEVIEARNGKEGLDALKEKPDLIWLDLYMPTMDGLSFLKELRKDSLHKDIPLILVTVSHGKIIQAKKTKGLNIIEIIIKSDCSLKDIITKVDHIFQ